MWDFASAFWLYLLVGASLVNLRWLRLVGLALGGLMGAALDARAYAPKDAAEERQMLWQQGFKTDLLEFDFSTDQRPRVPRNEISVWNLKLPAIGQMDRKWLKPILNASFEPRKLR